LAAVSDNIDRTGNDADGQRNPHNLTACCRAQKYEGSEAKDWLPFLNTYRTMCTAPSLDFLEALEGISALRVAA
jgi:hypothetical protein